MDLKQIEKLMHAMGRAGMKRMVLKHEGFELELEKENSGSASGSVTYEEPLAIERRPAPLPAPADAKNAPEGEKPPGQYITSPMVGTFYSSPSPEDPPFVKVGDKVEEGTVVCIIEAMKVMNEVKAGIRGTLAEVLVKNGDPLEFGTKIFRIV